MKVRWTGQAELDRLAIASFIAKDDVQAAVRMDARFGRVATQLAAAPHMGRRGSIVGTREAIPHPHYRIVYEILDAEIWILTIIHTSRLWPPKP